MKFSFKKRIALFNTVAVAAITLVVFISIYAVVYYTSYHLLDNNIRVEKGEIFANLDYEDENIIIKKMPEWEEAEHQQVEINPTFFQVADKNGNIIFRSANLQGNRFLFDPYNKKETFSNTTINNKRIRQAQFPFYNNAGKIIGQLTIGISRQESYNVLRNLLFILCTAFPVMILILYLVISFSASKAIAPVYQLIHTASRINDTNINTRLALPKKEDEIYLLATTINELLNRIEQSINQQKQFTADASHEMRTPLAAVRGNLEVLIRNRRQPEYYEEKIKEVIGYVDRLNLLFEQLLQISRLESGAVIADKQLINLKEFINTLAGKWQKELTQKQIVLHADIPDNCMIKADPFLMESIIDNVISNAVKYNHRHGNIHLSCNCTTLSIKDDGQGIAPEQLPYLFNRFYRADQSRNSRVHGSGLGLAIVKKLADMQQIGISINSTEGKGTVVTLQFPA